MAKNFDLVSTLNANLSRSMDDEKKYTAERLERGDLAEFHAIAAATGGASPAIAGEGTAAPAAAPESSGRSVKTKRTPQPRAAKRATAETATSGKSRMSYLPTDDDNLAINRLVGRAYGMNRRLTMSQVIRVAVRALVELNDDELLDAIDSTPEMVRGRPRQ